jgi:catechol 2,3-dioxygenase-like lactoylglutathione lyase family enzyme
MPSITGYLCPTLTVTDKDRSASWYRELFDMYIRRENAAPDGSLRDVCLVEPATGLEIALVEYASGSREPFDEFHPGLDHLEFLVANRSDLDDWAARLDALGIEHSGIKEPYYTPNAMITFRDPDNIQLEFFWLAPRDDTASS